MSRSNGCRVFVSRVLAAGLSAVVGLGAVGSAASIAGASPARPANVGSAVDWSQLAISGPPARDYAAIATDRATGRIVLFGGRDSSGSVLGDTWTFDGSAWHELSPATSPPALAFAAMATDATTGQVVLFGGQTASENRDDTWIFDGSTWALQSPLARPKESFATSMGTDPATGRVLLFGGVDNSTGDIANDTWRFDGTTWTQLAPAASPPPRVKAAMATDPVSGRLVLFGGYDSSGLRSDTWSFDGDTWSEIAPSPSPERFDATLATDAVGGRVVLFGGDQYGNALGDEWVLDASGWTQVSSPTFPPARAGAVAATDPRSGRPMVFGGREDLVPNATASLADTWVMTDAPDAPHAPTITGTPPAHISAGYFSSYSFTLTGSPAPSVDVILGTLPAGMTVSPDGVLSGIPAAPGTYGPIIVRAANGVASNGTDSFSVVVDPPGVFGFDFGSLPVGTTGPSVPATIPLQIDMASVPSNTVVYNGGNGTLDFALNAVGLSLPLTTGALIGVFGDATVSYQITALALQGGVTSDFAIGTGDCVGSVAASCTASAQFAPVEVGPRADRVQPSVTNVSVSGGGLPGAIANSLAGFLTPFLSQFDQVQLTGVGTAPVLVAPLAHDLGSTVAGDQSASLPYTVFNVTGVAVHISTLTSDGPDAGDFTVTSDPCSGTTIAVGDHCDFGVAFTPGGLGLRAARFRVAYAVPGFSATGTEVGSPVSVYANGTGTAAISAGPTSVDFPKRIVDHQSTTRSVVVHNNSAAPVTVTALSISGANAGDFSVASPSCTGAPIPAGGDCTALVKFAPHGTGVRTGALVISYDRPGGPASVSLSGRGVAPVVNVSTDQIGFGAVPVGSSASALVTVTNSGDGSLTIKRFGIGGGQPANFAVVDSSECLSRHVPAGGTCAFVVAFTPLKLGPSSAALVLHDNAASNPTIALTGSGTPAADLHVSIAASQNLIHVNKPLTYTVSALDTGPNTAVGATLQIVLAAHAHFVSIDQPGCHPPLAGATGTVTCALGNLAPNASFLVHVVVTLNGATGTSATTIASASSATFDPDPSDNQATAIVNLR